MERELKNQWCDLVQNFTADAGLAEELFAEIRSHYTAMGRHYHTLAHIAHLLCLYHTYHFKLEDPESVQFAIWYHDLIYEPGHSDNEARSAEIAGQRLGRLAFPEPKVQQVQSLILATHYHRQDSQMDHLNGRFFLDCDLSILGADRERYVEYIQEIRQEYIMVPLAAYKRGREAVLQQFLQKGTIYQTAELRERFEVQARSNIQFELMLLKG